MKNLVRFSTLILVGLVLNPSSGWATTITLTGTNNTTPEALTGTTNTFSLSSGGTLTINNSTAALTLNGNNPSTDGVTNLGTINQTGSAQAIVDAGGHQTITITNGSSTNSAATLETSNADVVHLDHATNNVTLNNYGSIISKNSSAGGNQAIDWNGITDGATAGEGANTLNNYSTGLIQASEADAVRPGIDGVVNNSGTIKSTSSTNSSSDGIDAQNNTGIVITNAASLGTGGANLIEGARHGITGGAEVNQSLSNYDQPFVMTVTNNVGGTIQGDNGSGINLDGVDATEVITVYNYGTITGDGVSRDGDGIDVDGILNLTNTGKIISKNAYQDASEGVTVGGGTIINSGTIEGSSATNGGTLYGRGITLAGIDHLTANNSQGAETDYSIPIQSIYGTTTVTNQAGGLIKGDSESGITVLGTTATAGHGFTVTINNNAGATIEGSNTGVTEDTVLTGTVEPGDAGDLSGGSANQAVIELDDANQTYVINESGTITQDTPATGTAIAMNGTISNALNITGGSASITGNIAGNTAANSTLTINPGAGNSFSYGYTISNFTVKVNSDGTNGTVTLSGANTYSGPTTVAGGKLYVNNTTGSGTGTGPVSVSGGATLAGSGIIRPGSGNGIKLAANSTLISGGVQSGTTAGHGLTLDNTVAGGTILDASVGSAKLTFYLGAGNTSGAGTASFATPNTNSTFLTVLGNTVGEVSLAAGDTITLTDLTGGNLQLGLSTPYLLIQAGTTPNLLSDNDLFAGLTTTGDINGLQNQNGYVTTPITIAGNTAGEYTNLRLYLDNGDLEVVPEPSTWAMLLGGVGLLAFFRRRTRRA